MVLYLVICCVLLILILIMLKLYFTLKEPFTSPKDYSEIQDNDVIVLTYDTESIQTTKTGNLIAMLSKLGFPYIEVLGENDKWTGWSGRTIAYRDYLNSFPNKNAFILICDGRDVLPNTTYFNFRDILRKRYNGKIIFGVEKNCCTGYLNTPLYKTRHMATMRQIKETKSNFDTDAFYLNFGLAFGKVNDFITLFKTMNVNKKDFDDQAETAEMMVKTDAFELDYEEKLGANVHGYGDNFKFTYAQSPFLLEIERRNATPCFFHFPAHNKSYETVLEMTLNRY